MKTIPRITTERTWSPDDIRALCIEHGWYKSGTNDDYNNMLTMVTTTRPTPENMYAVAVDIAKHTMNAPLIATIMFELERKVYTFFHIEGHEEAG